MKKIAIVLASVASMLNLVGCGRFAATTEIQPNGNWSRKLVFKYPAPDPKSQGIQMGPDMEKIFGIPTGPEWKTVKTKDPDKDKNEVIITSTRNYTAGQITPAFALFKDAMGKTVMTDTVIVKSAGPNRWEYRETLHWAGQIGRAHV